MSYAQDISSNNNVRTNTQTTSKTTKKDIMIIIGVIVGGIIVAAIIGVIVYFVVNRRCTEKFTNKNNMLKHDVKKREKYDDTLIIKNGTI